MLIRNLINIIKTGFFQFIGMVLLISFLLFFLNILLWLSYNISNFSKEVKHKLWIYFYIKDYEEKDLIYKSTARTAKLKEELEKNWLKVELFSKDDALKLLEKRMPDVIKNFDKYWIENPLPTTLYITFDNRDKYNKLKSIISGYNDIVLNIEDVSKWESFEEQEQRVLNIINLTDFIIIFSYFLVVVLIIIIMSFLMFVIKNNFYVFYKQIEVEKLIWAFYRQIKLPFLFKNFSILVLAFVFMLIYFSIFINILADYFNKVFNVQLWDYIDTISNILFKWFMWEFIIIIVLSLLISDFFLNRLLKRV